MYFWGKDIIFSKKCDRSSKKCEYSLKYVLSLVSNLNSEFWEHHVQIKGCLVNHWFSSDLVCSRNSVVGRWHLINERPSKDYTSVKIQVFFVFPHSFTTCLHLDSSTFCLMTTCLASIYLEAVPALRVRRQILGGGKLQGKL